MAQLTLAQQLEASQAELARLQADNAALAARNAALSRPGKLTLKVSEKGGISLYGMGRWPVTLYREQWETVLSQAAEIKAFIAAHDGVLKHKGDEPRVSA